MNYRFKIRKAKPIFITLFILLFILLFLVYYFIIYDIFAKEEFATNISSVTIQNENAIFKVHKALIYSSAIPIENEDSEFALENISITQYSDIAIYLDNTVYIYDITDTNTIKELYINNITVSTNDDSIGDKYLNYKNYTDFGKFINLETLTSIDSTYISDNTIVFDVINNNEENNENDYDNPSFYADCSNPITLSYINENILTNYSVSDTQSIVSFNGKVLGESNTDLSNISYTISFSINIVNKLDEKFICNYKITTDLTTQNSKISSEGYLYTTNTYNSDEFEFFSLTTNN